MTKREFESLGSWMERTMPWAIPYYLVMAVAWLATGGIGLIPPEACRVDGFEDGLADHCKWSETTQDDLGMVVVAFSLAPIILVLINWAILRKRGKRYLDR